MTAALALLEENLDQGLRLAGVVPTAEIVGALAQGVADWLEVLPGEAAVERDVNAAALPDGRGTRLAPYWSHTTLAGLALMVRRRR